MQRTLENMIELSSSMGYNELSNILENAKKGITLKHIRDVKITENDFTEQDVLYFYTGNREQKCENAIYIEDESLMYKAAYQALSILQKADRIWYEKIIEANLKFNDITLKQPDLVTMIKYFNQLMRNPVIIYDEFLNITTITDEYLRKYDLDESQIERLEMNNLFYFKQKVIFHSPDAPKESCNRLFFPVIFNGMWKGYLAIFDMNTPYDYRLLGKQAVAVG